MIINLELDAAAQAAPAAVKAIWQEAANIIGSMFTDNITINLSVDYSGTGGGASAGPTNGVYESYSTVYNYLTGGASPGDSSFDYLPTPGSANAPTEVGVWNAELKAMSAAGYLAPGGPGYLSPTGSEIDGEAFFDTDISLSSLLGVALHEFTHAMGRVPFTDGSDDPDVMEFERFTSVGNRLSNNSIPAPPSYFSLNGGATSWAAYGQGSDPSDFLNSINYSGYGSSPLTPEDAFDEYYDSNTLQYLTPVDLEQMDILGFHLKSDAPAEDPYDFNGSNSGDILLQSTGGQIEYANMANGSFQGIVSVTNMPGWKVVGQGKISGGVDSDIVIQNGSKIDYVDLVNGAFSQLISVGSPTGFVVVGVGDIADNHYTDIVIQNPVTDEVGYANMDNGVFNNWYSVADPVGWKAVAVADINGDGYADIVIQNQTTGEVGYANMDNGVLNGFVSLGEPQGYNVVGAGDINRLGDADVVVQNPTTDAIGYANMINGVVNGWVSIGDPTGWSVIAVEDILGNGFDDIVIQNNSNGQIDYANMTDGSFQGWVSITSAPSGFTGATGPAPVGDTAATGGVTAATNVSMPGAGFADAGGQSDGNLPSASSTADAGTQSIDPFTPPPPTPGTPITFVDSEDSATPAGNGFISSIPDLPQGVFEAIRDAGNSAPTVSSTSSSATQNNSSIAQDGLGTPAPGIPSGGSVQSTFTTAAGGVAEYLNNGSNNGSAAGLMPNSNGTSANWLTDGALPGGTSSSNSVQNAPNAAEPIVAADDLTHSLKFGT
jgi:hypothetical protein